MTDDALSRPAWSSFPAITLAGGAGAPHRSAHPAGSVACADLGVRQPWSVQAGCGPGPTPRTDVVDATEWLSARGVEGDWVLAVPAPNAADAAFAGLNVIGTKAAFAMATREAARIVVPPADSTIEIDEHPLVEDIITASGIAMGDVPLARRLFVREDLDDRDRAFLVARRQGRPVGCAQIRWASGTGYLSGIGVDPDQRGRGVGRLLTCYATRLATRDDRAQLVWMRASAAGAPLYSRLGFARIADEVTFGSTRADRAGRPKATVRD